MNACTLTIVTITYNDPAGLARTLTSLKPLKNASFSWEWVVVDSSAEKNQAVLSSAGQKLPLKHLLSPALGVYAAMNRGWQEAKGSCIWFLNGGDTLVSVEAVAEGLHMLMARPDVDLVYGAAELWRDGSFLYTRWPRNLFWGNLGINRICHQALLYRRSLLQNLGGFSEKLRLASDYDLHLRALHDHPKNTQQLPAVLVRYDMGGLSSDYRPALREFRAVQSALAREGKLYLPWLHALVHRWECLRLAAMNQITSHPWGRAARYLVYKIKRLP